MNAIGQFLVNAVGSGQLSIERPIGLNFVDGIEEVLCGDIRAISLSMTSTSTAVLASSTMSRFFVLVLRRALSEAEGPRKRAIITDAFLGILE